MDYNCPDLAVSNFGVTNFGKYALCKLEMVYHERFP